MKKILIIRLGAFGDILQAEGAIHDIRNHHPDDQITILTTSPYRKIFERCPWIDRILIDPRAPRHHIFALLRTRKMLRDEYFDIIYDLQNSGRTLMYRAWLDATWSQKDEDYNLEIARRRGRKLAILERIGLQLEQAGISLNHTLKPDVSWMADNVEDLLTVDQLDKGFILLNPGSSARHIQKRWPYYFELAQALMDKGLRVITAPGPDEIELCRSLPCPALFDGGKPLSFFRLAGLLKRANYVIGNDTGPTHLAAYLGVRGLALYGSHTSARATGLDAFLDIIEVSDLSDLKVERVLSHVLDAVKSPHMP
jgi:ADP-heptose:LPS heptosyltransferase